MPSRIERGSEEWHYLRLMIGLGTRYDQNNKVARRNHLTISEDHPIMKKLAYNGHVIMGGASWHCYRASAEMVLLEDEFLVGYWQDWASHSKIAIKDVEDALHIINK